MKGWISKKWMIDPIARPRVAPTSSTTGNTAYGGPPVTGELGAQQRRQRDDGSDREVDAPGQDHERHPDHGDEQEGVVDEQVEEHLPGPEVGVVERAGREHRHDEAQGHEHRHVPHRDAAVRRAEPVAGVLDGGHAGTSTARSGGWAPGGGRSPVLTRRRRGWTSLARKAGDWARQTAVTTSALKSSVVSGRDADRVDRRRQGLDQQRADEGAGEEVAAARGGRCRR